MSTKKSTSLAFLLIFLLSACESGLDLPRTFDPELEIPIEEMNKEFIIKDPAINQNSYKNQQILLLDLENLSTSAIVFPGDFNLSVYQQTPTQWKQVNNILGDPEGDWVLPTSSEFKGGIGLDLIPSIPNLEKPVTIRVIAIGKLETNDERVGAYIDLTLLP